MSDLIIVESPSKIHTVKRTLGDGYNVVACVGHVRDLPKSKLAVDVEHGFEPTYVDIAGKENVIKDIKSLPKSRSMCISQPTPTARARLFRGTLRRF